MFSLAVHPMKDDLIDDEGFDCFYTREEMLEQQCRLLIEEIDDAWQEVRRARQNVAKLVQINTQLYVELARLTKESDRVRWEMSEHLRHAGLKAASQNNALLGAHGRVTGSK